MKKWTTGKTIAVTVGIIAAILLMTLLFVISLLSLGRKVINHTRQEYQGETEYYSFGNDIHENLSYKIEFQNFNPEISSDKKILLSMDYPVVSSDSGRNMEAINAAIQQELQVMEQYAHRREEYVGVEDDYKLLSETYVTYMSEERLSVVYLEKGYLNGVNVENYIVPVNLDMESGMKLSNTQILKIDDDFSIDFRNRSEVQNGSGDLLSEYTDQDITTMLTNENHLILFYTPLGMEVGFNFEGGYVTVTYKDYRDFENQF